MKIFKSAIVIVAIALSLAACKNNTKPEAKTVAVEISNKENTAKLDPNATYAKVEFNIKGMTCEMGCAKTIEKKLAHMEGVKSAKVDFKNELAMVEYDVAKANPTSITKTVTSVADTYSVENMKTVAEFSGTKKQEANMACKPDCKMACCKDKTKTEKTTIACAKDCEKACCKEEKA